MIPGMNPKMMKQAMKKMGMKQEEIDASEVIIRCPDREFIFQNPQVSKIEVMGQETWQIVGEAQEVDSSQLEIKQEDVDLVAEQTGCSKEQAQQALEENDGDIAKAILTIQQG